MEWSFSGESHTLCVAAYKLDKTLEEYLAKRLPTEEQKVSQLADSARRS